MDTTERVEAGGRIERILKATAITGKGDRLADLLLEAADGARDMPGCELYLIARDRGEPDAVWVTEIWSGHDAAQAALVAPGVAEQVERVKPLIASWDQRHELIPIGGLDA